ncbi:SCP2 sterol-binding domain-containing protein [Nitrospira sp. BLG_1]|uniref:SCP2 sterol-binding domain-containing protein n=1 Tax=Nitrospira sp. BLG_1 TaxID=3395883 RepID=UPI0039BD7ECF
MKVTTIQDVLRSLPAKFDKEAAENLDAVYQFDLQGDQGGQYHLVVQNGTCLMKDGAHADPHVTLSMTGEDCIKVLNGQVSGMMMAMSGRLQVTGDIGLAMQLKSLFPNITKS